jgi:hypothetical protein
MLQTTGYVVTTYFDDKGWKYEVKTCLMSDVHREPWRQKFASRTLVMSLVGKLRWSAAKNYANLPWIKKEESHRFRFTRAENE